MFFLCKFPKIWQKNKFGIVKVQLYRKFNQVKKASPRPGVGNIRPAQFSLVENFFFNWNPARKTQINTQCGPRTKIVGHPCPRPGVSNSTLLEGQISKKWCLAGRSLFEKSLRLTRLSGRVFETPVLDRENHLPEESVGSIIEKRKGCSQIQHPLVDAKGNHKLIEETKKGKNILNAKSLLHIEIVLFSILDEMRHQFEQISNDDKLYFLNKCR